VRTALIEVAGISGKHLLFVVRWHVGHGNRQGRTVCFVPLTARGGRLKKTGQGFKALITVETVPDFDTCHKKKDWEIYNVTTQNNIIVLYCQRPHFWARINIYRLEKIRSKHFFDAYYRYDCSPSGGVAHVLWMSGRDFILWFRQSLLIYVFKFSLGYRPFLLEVVVG
jgi:hypothetical protein